MKNPTWHYRNNDIYFYGKKKKNISFEEKKNSIFLFHNNSYKIKKENSIFDKNYNLKQADHLYHYIYLFFFLKGLQKKDLHKENLLFFIFSVNVKFIIT